jgi:uncharacterized protein YbjT (DUF2867 family)
MRVFVTGARLHRLRNREQAHRRGHQVIGLARSNKSAKRSCRGGARVGRAQLADIESLRSAARQA